MIKEITLDETKKLIDENERVLLIFSAKWCGPCQMTKLIFSKIFSQYEDQIEVGKIDVDEQEAWAENEKNFKIDHVPTVLGYKNGKEIFNHVGFLSEPAWKELLDKLLL